MVRSIKNRLCHDLASIGLFEAKIHVAELVARAEHGEEVMIACHSRPVANTVPVHPRIDDSRARHERALGELVEFRRCYRLGGVSMHELIEDGRKYLAPACAMCSTLRQRYFALGDERTGTADFMLTPLGLRVA